MQVPEEWTLSKLSSFVDLHHGYQFRDYDFTESGIPVIKIGNVSGSNLDFSKISFIDSCRLEEFKKVHIVNGDILMSLTGNVGRVIEVRGLTSPVLQNYRVGKFVPIDESKLSKLFLKCVLKNENLFKQLELLSNQSAQANFGKQDLDKLTFLLPPLPEQKKIAEILSTCDECIENTEKQIAKLKDLKKATMQELLTKGIGHTEFKDSPLGRIPESWGVVRLEELMGMKSGDSITSKSILKSATYPVYGGNGLRGYTENYTHHGDFVLIGRQGALCGNITRVNGKVFASEHAVVVTHGSQMDTDWIENKLIFMNLNQYSEASAQPGLSVAKLLRLKIAYPLKLEEQQRIGLTLKSIDSNIENKEQKLSKLKDQNKALMNDLLTGKVRVN